MMGLPKFHTWKLPSRNWCIFWTALGSFGGGIAYDRYEKRQIIARYRGRVAHLAEEPLQPLQMPRKMNIYLGAPPGDTIHVAREHFNEYIKPVLNSAAVDFELIEGKMQGDIRHRVAEAIRNRRKGFDGMTDLTRAAKDKLELDHQGGDIVLGRHTYKEYLRGFHEGVLGPVTQPEEITAIMNPWLPGDPITEAPKETDELASTTSDNPTGVESVALHEKPVKSEEDIQKEVAEIKRKIPSSPPSYIKPSEYESASLEGAELTNFTYVPLQHLLGFLNTPWRIYRFLNRRALAEEMCSATTSAVLASRTRAFDPALDSDHGRAEELDWPKKNRQKEDGVWVEAVYTDKRVVEYLHMYQMDQ